MNVINKFSFSRFDFDPNDAHREGSLGYYIWSIGALIARLQDYNVPAKTLFYSRLISILFDVASVALVFLIGTKLSSKKSIGLFSALLFAILPFEVIYSRYMRPHTMANFFVLATVYFSTFLEASSPKIKFPYLKIGILAGLATATRYPSVIVLFFPVFLLILETFKNKTIAIQQAVKGSLLIGVFWILGFFIADPYLFLDFQGATSALSAQASYADSKQFTTLSSVFDFSKSWDYLTNILPLGTYPFLWALFYGSFVYLICTRKWHYWFMALSCPTLINFAAMTKGYLTSAEFVRTLVFLFPFLCLISGIAFADFLSRFRKNKWIFRPVIFLIAIIISSTIAFDLAYVIGMTDGKDTREQLTSYLNTELDAKKTTHIGLWEEGPYNSFVAMPALDPYIKSKTVRVSEQPMDAYINRSLTPDYIVIGALHKPHFNEAISAISKLEETGRFQLLQTFENSPKFLGIEFNHEKFPHDMSYPYPKLYLLKSTDSKSTF